MKRHLILAFISTLTIPLFHLTRSNLQPMHSWNRAFADLAFIFLLGILFLGPLARLDKRLVPCSDWRRELGIWSVLLSFPHVIIFFYGWIEWDLWLLFYSYSPSHDVWAVNHGFGLGNALGIIALFYGIKLFSTSNDLSLHILGKSAWKYLQQATSTFYLLASIHTAYFLYFHFSTLQRPNPPTSWFNVFFVFSVSILFIVRLFVFWFTVRQNVMCRKRNEKN